MSEVADGVGETGGEGEDFAEWNVLTEGHEMNFVVAGEEFSGWADELGGVEFFRFFRGWVALSMPMLPATIQAWDSRARLPRARERWDRWRRTELGIRARGSGRVRRWAWS